jgi:hypothetical protein
MFCGGGDFTAVLAGVSGAAVDVDVCSSWLLADAVVGAGVRGCEDVGESVWVCGVAGVAGVVGACTVVGCTAGSVFISNKCLECCYRIHSTEIAVRKGTIPDSHTTASHIC